LTNINYSNSTYKLSWTASGDGVEKRVYIIIDGDRNNAKIETVTRNTESRDTIMPGLSHGVHTIEMYMEATIGTQNLSTTPIIN
jgi:hypothetical protein